MTHRFTGLVAALVVTLPCFLVSEAAEAQDLTLNEVLARTTSYVERLHDQLRGDGDGGDLRATRLVDWG